MQWFRDRGYELISLVFGRHSDLLDHLGELLGFEDVNSFCLSHCWLILNWIIEDHFLLLSHSQFLLQLLSIKPLDLLWVGNCFGNANFLFFWLTLSLHHLELDSLLLIFFE